MRGLTRSLVLALLLTLAAVPSASAHGHGWGTGHEESDPGRSGDSGGRGGGSSDGPRRYPHYSVELVTGGAEDGEDCWALSVAWLETEQAADDAAAARSTYDFFVTNDRGLGACPGGGIDLPGLAREYWLEAIPTPSAPTVDPGRLVTGMPAYLVLEGERTLDVSFAPLPGVSLWIRGEATYIIDWGDGTSSTTTSQGVPYPGGPGEITHTYTSVPAGGAVTITVTARWTGTSSAGPLPTIDRVSSLTLPIEEVQAVRDR